MTKAWPFRLSGFVTGVLVAGALAFLQALNDEKDLFSCLCAVGVIAVAALIALSSPLAPKIRPDFLCLTASGVFFSYIIIRAVASPAGHVARLDLYCVLGGLTLYGIILTAYFSSSRRIALILGLLAFATVHVLVSVVEFGLGRNYDLLFPTLARVAHNPRAAGLFVDPDHLAGLLEVLGILGLSITAWSRWPNWARVFLGYLTAVCYFGLILTGSRGGYLSAATSLIVFCLMSFLTLRAASLTHVAKFGGGGLILFGLILYASWFFIHENPGLQKQMETIATPDEGRLDLWQAAIEQWRLHPIVGTGSGTYLYYGRQFRAPQMQEDPVDVHNDYLNLLCEYGLLGMLGFAFFFGAHVHRGLKAFYHLGPRRIADGSSLRSDRLALTIGALCAIAAYVVHSFVDFNFHIPANALLFAIVFGLLANPGIQTLAPETPVVPLKPLIMTLALLLLLQCVRLIPGEYFALSARDALYNDDPATAIVLAEKALTKETRNPDIYFYLGRALVASANSDERKTNREVLYTRALQAFEQARGLAPLDGTYPLELARVYDRLGRFNEAESMLNLARERDPRSDSVAAIYKAHLEKANEASTTR